MHFIVTIGHEPLVSKVRALISLYGLRVMVDTYWVPKDPIQCKNCLCFGYTKHSVAYGGLQILDRKCMVTHEHKRCAKCNFNHTAN